MKKSRVLSSILGLLPLLLLSPWVGADTPTSSPPVTPESHDHFRKSQSAGTVF